MGATAEAAVRPAAAHAPGVRTQSYRVVGAKDGHYLAVRASMSPSSRVVGHLAAGAATTGTGRSSHGFVEVRASNGRTGWVPVGNIEKIEPKRR